MKRKTVALITTVVLAMASPAATMAESLEVDGSNAYSEASLVVLDVGDLLLSKNTFIDTDGSDKYPFEYSYEDGDEIRVGLVDVGKKGLLVKIYYVPDEGKKVQVFKGVTSSRNGYQFTETFTPSNEGNYQVVVTSSDGEGGPDYQYRLNIRGI